MSDIRNILKGRSFSFHDTEQQQIKKENKFNFKDVIVSNEVRIRYWYFMFLSLTNVKISNKDFNWKKKKKIIA
jgi:hypothetical protein